MERYTSQDIKEREADKIVMVVRQLVRDIAEPEPGAEEDQEQEEEPVIDAEKQPAGEEYDEALAYDQYQEDEDDADKNFVYFYDEDDEEGANFHDEL